MTHHVIVSSLSPGHLPSLESISQRFISPSLQDFSFGDREVSFDDLTFMGPIVPSIGDDVDDDDNWEADRTITGPEAEMNVDQPHQVEVDFFTGDQAVGDDFGGGDFGMVEDMGLGMDQDTVVGSPAPEEGHPSQDDTGIAEPFNSRRMPNEKELVMAMTEEDGSGMMDYFDQTFLKNWAGPEHWKLRKVVRKGWSEK